MNQVAAVVYARFHRKQMPEGRAVFGTFTRDYRNDALTCQVLITVPQCLEILMMSPKRQDWVAKMRYVIFDEVNTKGIPQSKTNSKFSQNIITDNIYSYREIRIIATFFTATFKKKRLMNILIHLLRNQH